MVSLALGALLVAAGLGGRYAAPPAPAVRMAPPAAAVPAATSVVHVAAPAPAPADVLRFELRALGLSASGCKFASISANGGPPGRHVVGDSVGVGVRVAAIRDDEVELERGDTRERLRLPPGARPLSPMARHPAAEAPRMDDPQGVIARPLDAPLPSSTPIERAIRRAAGAKPQ